MYVVSNHRYRAVVLAWQQVLPSEWGGTCCQAKTTARYEYTGLSKRNGAKLRESFCPAAASHSRLRQAGA